MGYNVALTHLRITCDGLEIRFDLALEWLTARLMVDAERRYLFLFLVRPANWRCRQTKGARICQRVFEIKSLM